MIIAKFLKTPVLKNISERLNVLLHEQITLATGSEEDIFYQLDEKNLSLHDVLHRFVFLYFCTACFRRRLPYLIEDDRSEAL